MARKAKNNQNLPVIEANAAGVDVSAAQIFVAVPAASVGPAAVGVSRKFSSSRLYAEIPSSTPQLGVS